MSVEIIGDLPLATDERGNLKSHIGTFFVSVGVLVTLPGMPHALQHLAYHAHLNRQRKSAGLPALSHDALMTLSANAVDLIMKGRDVLIRPDPSQMPLAFRADEQLQELVPKQHIRFLNAHHPNVQQTIRERGEYWRISPLPRNKDAIIKAIRDARVAIGGQPIYFYNPETGSRFLTVQSFSALATLDDADLRRHLIEIRDYSSKFNRTHYREVSFFAAGDSFGSRDFAGQPFEALPEADLRAVHVKLCERFRSAVPAHLHKDAPNDPEWRKRMFDSLSELQSDVQTDAIVSGLSPEFFRQIYWHPGGRIENGELVFDSIFDEAYKHPDDPELCRLCDDRVKGFIRNYIREFGGILYVNIGGILPEMRQRPPVGGHRAYIAEVMYRGADKPVLRILRIQRWGIRERLDEDKDLLWAVMEGAEYTEYTLDRRLGCWELGMPLPGRIDTRHIAENYFGKQQKYHGTRIWTTYFERDFIDGMATDKIPEALLKDAAFMLRVARLLGQAAAPNLVVGRTDGKGNVTFDSGDEMILMNELGIPERIVVADHAGTFNDVNRPLVDFAADYARPAVSRAKQVANLDACIQAYLEALSSRLSEMKHECRLRRHAFNALFYGGRQGPGTFSDRWNTALDRLENTDVAHVVAAIRSHIEAELEKQNRNRNGV
ncbi:MAG TPA: hypothetical protein PKM57_13255 [Kiritimatiellia bacterium]|nr:hypothetical protein [Kiritimatiellia bacterium]HPS07496.1 hypothetical protein [Kiritimatiellia bacterium]